MSRRTLARISAVGARTAEDARRFAALGFPEDRLEITGDLKLEPPIGPPDLAPELEQALAGLPFWVAASTHAGEEEAALHALSAAESAGVATALLVGPPPPFCFRAGGGGGGGGPPARPAPGAPARGSRPASRWRRATCCCSTPSASCRR